MAGRARRRRLRILGLGVCLTAALTMIIVFIEALVFAAELKRDSFALDFCFVLLGPASFGLSVYGFVDAVIHYARGQQ